MTYPRLKKYIEIKKDPSLATLKHLESIETLSKSMVEKAITDVISEAQTKFQKEVKDFVFEVKSQLPDIIKNLTTEIRDFIHSNPRLFKGEKGDSIKGEDGKTPTIEEIVETVKSHIPPAQKGEDGKTPIPELDYPSERQIKEMISKMGSDMKKEHEKKMKEMMPKIKLPTFDEIARGIESLPEKQKLDYYKGLKNTPNISNDTPNNGIIRGGGMGNVETQSTNISSATTTINLSYNVASNGKAIWFNYQGQQQQLGVHFTVSGRTITLLFTPDDNTVADIIYIRK